MVKARSDRKAPRYDAGKKRQRRLEGCKKRGSSDALGKRHISIVERESAGFRQRNGNEKMRKGKEIIERLIRDSDNHLG